MSVESEADPEQLITPPEERQPLFEGERMVVGELVPDEELGEDQDAVTELTAEERRDLSTLLTMGRRVKRIVVMDHAVTIQTLKTVDEMRIGLFTKDYLETQGFSRAYQVGVCAAGIVDIDGRPLYSPISDSESGDAIFAKKTDSIKEYYPIVISQIYDEIIKLEREFAELALQLGKLPG